MFKDEENVIFVEFRVCALYRAGLIEDDFLVKIEECNKVCDVKDFVEFDCLCDEFFVCGVGFMDGFVVSWRLVLVIDAT